MQKNSTRKIQLSSNKWVFRLALLIFCVGTFQQVQSQDMGVTSLISPVAPICSAINQTVVVSIKNYNTDTIYFDVDTVIVTLNVSGASTQTFNDTITLGALAPDSVQNITVTNLCDFSVSGVHYFNAYTSVNGELNTLNDSLITDSITVNLTPPVPTISAYDSTAFCVGDTVLLISSSATGNLWTGGGTDDSLLVSASGDYLVTVTIAGCTSVSDTAAVVMYSIPATPTITTSDTTFFCVGESVILFSSNNTGNTWTGGGTNDSLIVTASGVITVTATLHGCTSIASDAVVVTVNPLPTVSLSPFLISPCSQTAAFSLFGGSPIGGTYSGQGVTPDGIFHPASAGAIQGIYYTVTDLNGCSNTASQNLSVSDCTGIEENDSQGISVYPNPTINGLINIAVKNANFNELLVSIIDIQGKEVFNATDKNSTVDYNKQIDITHLAKGIYYIKISTVSDVEIKKLLVE